ncbi:MAG TPA: hypothetical protein VJX74_19070 [Blastocatellia bacterium]|nr:hypothetical protein [Blastocatellia bacterium]
MPAKRQPKTEKNDAVKSKSKSKARHYVPDDEAPVIIKGSSQGPGAVLHPWTLTSDVKLLERSVKNEDVYTLSEGKKLRGFVILDSEGDRIFEFPNSVHSGEFAIKFFS